MSSSSPIGARWLVIAVPLLFVGCFVVGDGGSGDDEGDDGDGASGCRRDAECRQGRVCLDLNGNRNDTCEEGEDCACGSPGSGNGGSSGGGTGGDTSVGGGANDGGAGDGGSTTGGNATGGNETGGNATGGNATGGAMGGNATGGSLAGGAGRGGSATGGSAGAGTADCGAYCARVVGAMCTQPSQAACLAECDALAEDCPAEAPGVMACVVNPSNTITCLSGSPVINGCNPQLDARDRCLICLPATGDGTCAACSKGSCCDEAGDYGLASDGAAFYECASPCADQVCFDACVEDYPIAGNALIALVECENMSCPEQCICEVITGDDSCTSCYKSSCCAETVDYTNAPDVKGFEVCANACGDDALCIEDCADDFPEAGAALRAWTDCVNQECLAECG
jgi:hypothetical protein